MLTRTFRLTDKFSNAFLKIAVWLAETLLIQVTALRQSTERAVVGFYSGTKQTASRGRKAYDATDTRRRSLMAQRAVIVQTDGGVMQPALIEDPLIRQNRTLSVFAVVLMAALIGIVLWATNQENTRGTNSTGNLGGILPQNTNAPTAPVFNTPVPTSTPVPQPLNWRGTLAFALRQNGQEDVFAFQRGDNQPRRLTNNPADDRDPAWSPDGRTLAFVSNRDGNWELYLMDVITKEITRLTYSPSYEGSPTWSPDGAFLAYEAYVGNNLDLYIIAVETLQQYRVTYNEGPDFEPSWMPVLPDGTGGRRVAYTSIRNATQDIYILDLDNPSDGAAINLTNTPTLDENFADWSPDAQFIAYSARVDGIESVFYREVNAPVTEYAIGRGLMPAWNPQDGSSLFYTALRQFNQSQIVGATPGRLGGGGDVQIINGIVSDLQWMTAEPEFEPVVANYAPLYEESSVAPASGIYGLANLAGIEIPDAVLNAHVDDSFNGLRLRVREKTGLDYLEEIEDAFWRTDRLPEVGQPRENWHYAGRAFGLDRNLVFQDNPPRMVVVREDREIGTYWRVYLRVNDQSGALGEPLRRVPWDFAARTNPDDLTAYEQGGKRMSSVPIGYYIDLTELASDYGWLPLAADRTWRQNYAGILYWELVKTDNLDWHSAMRELYTEDQLSTFGAGPVIDATPTFSEEEEVPTDEPERSPTPVPPDQQ